MARQQSLCDVDRMSKRAAHSCRGRLRSLSKMVRQRAIINEVRDQYAEFLRGSNQPFVLRGEQRSKCLVEIVRVRAG
jgi:hypothetical protein